MLNKLINFVFITNIFIGIIFGFWFNFKRIT